MIPSSAIFDQPTMENLLTYDPVVVDYRLFFSFLDWSLVSQWEEQQSIRGRPAQPEAAYIKAFLIRIREGMIYTSQLHRFLLKHPFLIIELGFHLKCDQNDPYGFDRQKTLPSEVYLRRKLQLLDQPLLQTLLQSTVHDLQEEIPGLGETVAFDVKHIYGWVKENNERVYVKDRYDKKQRLAGDPDCRLGVKKSSNRLTADHPDQIPAKEPPKTKKEEGKKTKETNEKKELIWGYGSGVAAATCPDYGDVILAEYTQPFNENDVTYFRPLFARVIAALSPSPTHLTADAAFDAWYIYQEAIYLGGIGAIPLNQHRKTFFAREADGTPRCPKNLLMHPTRQFNHTYGYRAQRFQCPLLFPEKTGETCDHEQFTKGKGCVKDVNWEPGGIQRVTLDRDSPLYKAIYTQRTSCERINSQAQALGIERPKVRNRGSVTNLNTLIYVVINVRTLQKAISTNKGLLQMH
jgi:hypothetical protein